MSVAVCVSVFVVSAIISSELHVRSSPTFSFMLPMVVARFCSGGVVIWCVFLVLWMASYLHTS